MQTKARYSFREIFWWTRNELLILLFYNCLAIVLYHVVGFTFLEIPWTPMALMGTAVAFLIGFQTNNAYGRIWEARKIWGAIVNSSRTFTIMTKDMISNAHTQNPVSEEELQNHIKVLIHRHVAWLTALRYAMRAPKKWEEYYKYKSNREFSRNYKLPEREMDLATALDPYLTAEEKDYVLSKGNKATTVLNLQSNHLAKLKDKGLLWEFSFLELENVIEELFTHQGKSERIKNFPYPKQFSSITFYITLIFIALLPFGLFHFFEEGALRMEKQYQWGHYFVYAAVPFSVLVSWVFSLMQRISLVGDNPFEGSGNDVPISNIARGIEIDIRQQIDESPEDIPDQFPEWNNIQM